ncbi:type II toxin-antitoxin system HicB family antitoxin [Patescibacteria group bacterium]|nr:type II toxin-antitoxin system HicB family antitoxin [Patescibacteria group bacterium]MBU4511730.1 type II toxin-antitoxin system HicB family antitoxin [Patescibacteria group bacterium]MCG2692831.1 type II toxin-antitoxin system HicB family antitoxin [Candidatus Parcubacteria bacterium]
MLTHYINNLIAQAKYEILKDDASYYGEIPGVQGVWANEKTLIKCQQSLREVLEEWLLIKLRRNEKLPVVKKIDLNVSFSASNKHHAFA